MQTTQVTKLFDDTIHDADRLGIPLKGIYDYLIEYGVICTIHEAGLPYIAVWGCEQYKQYKGCAQFTNDKSKLSVIVGDDAFDVDLSDPSSLDVVVGLFQGGN